MYAVVRSGGKQLRVSPGDVVNVEKLPVETGAKPCSAFWRAMPLRTSVPLTEATRRCVEATGAPITWDTVHAGIDVSKRSGTPLPDEVRPGLSAAVRAALPPAAKWVAREYFGMD